MSITRMSEQWVAARIKQKGDSKCIPWKTLRDLIVAHLDPKKRVDVFALNIYGLVIFPKALGHIDDVVLDPFDRLNKRVMPVPAILAETFRSLNACWRADEERFIGCAQLLLAWFHGHFWKIESTSIGSLYSGYGELLDMPFYLYSDSIDRGNPYRQCKGWLSAILRTRVIITRRSVPMSSQENTRPIKEHLQVIPSELEIIKQDFEKRSSELEKKIE
ncbi:hypothetical protein Gohar_026808 [Gossypium harknessii]|uniref:DUF7745 domain-containing protein n=2 Tax=Gossypium harknessii TaxID=34285 RepID=A0A7J9HSP5_9ROSI|nr:hypothetical protein [Gossypium harknessii]